MRQTDGQTSRIVHRAALELAAKNRTSNLTIYNNLKSFPYLIDAVLTMVKTEDVVLQQKKSKEVSGANSVT